MKRASSGAFALAVATLALPAAAQVDPQACVAAYEEVQADRQEGRLVVAKDKALFCAQSACPDVVKNDCANWLTEIDASLPTMTFQVKDASGQETTAVSVFYDGQLLRDKLDGKAVPVDPGEHTFRFEIPGSEPIEQAIVVREGEKNRKLEISFAKPSEGPSSAGAAGADLTPAEDEGVSPLAYVFGGLGLVGVGMFATFAILGTSEKSDLEAPVAEGGCAPNCTDEQVDSVRTKLIVADISLAVGVVSLGVAAYFFISAAMGDDSAATAAQPGFFVGAEPLPGGGFGTVGGRF